MQEPMKIVLATHRKPKGTGAKQCIVEVEDTMYYIPILETLQVLLNNDAIVAEVYTL